MVDEYKEYVCSQCGHETDTSIDSEFECPNCCIEMDEVKLLTKEDIVNNKGDLE